MPDVDNTMLVYTGVETGELEIDCDGRIWRVAIRRGLGAGRHGSVLAPIARRRAESTNRDGYYQISRKHSGATATIGAHRLVWVYFNGPIPYGLTINHKDGVRKNNTPLNLELATYKEQTAHAINVLGRAIGGNYSPKLTPCEVTTIRERLADGYTRKSLAIEFMVCVATIGHIATMKSWR